MLLGLSFGEVRLPAELTHAIPITKNHNLSVRIQGDQTKGNNALRPAWDEVQRVLVCVLTLQSSASACLP